MKISKFNIISKTSKKDEFLIYNTLTTSTAILNLKEKVLIEEENIKEMSHELRTMLTDLGFLIEDDENEFEYLRRLRQEVIDHPTNKLIDLMIAPTMDCNARCFYCFERGSHKEKMSKETADQLLKFMKENWDGNKIGITWFGGEPLIAPDMIDYISKGLKRINVEFSSKITTNGYNLTPSIIEKAVQEWNVKRIQISIDAYGEEYNKIKRYIYHDGIDPFERVIENIDYAINHSPIKIRCRINFDPVNLEKSYELFSFLEKRFGKYPNYSTYLAPIDFKYTSAIASKFEEKTEHPMLEVIKFCKQFGYFEPKIRKENFEDFRMEILSLYKLYPSPTNCYASCKNVWAIDSKGDLYKCHRLLGQGSEYSSGNIWEGIKKNKIFQFFSNTDLSYSKCESCKALPICQGGCKVNALIYKDEHACIPFLPILDELIEEYGKQVLK